MFALSRRTKVLFVERHPYPRTTLASLRHGELGWAELRRPLLERVSDTLSVYRPPLWALDCGAPVLQGSFRACRRGYLRYVLRRLGMEQPIVCFSMPAMISLCNDIPSARLQLYHVMDEYSGYRLRVGESRLRLQRNEEKMLAMVDIVLVVSEKLYDSKSPLNPHTCIIPNGVDYVSYERSLADAVLPENLRDIPEPRLGYIGLVGEKVDVGMLKQLAETHPEWSLVVLGIVNLDKQADTWRALHALPNVHLLEPVPAPQVPDYVKGFQVGLMPYVLDRQVQSSSPLKMYDYMAAGIPIASIDMPPARPFESLIYLADGPQDFERAVVAALADVSSERREARRQLAKQHSWDARVEQLLDVVGARLGEQEPGA
jgi:glycosyltransferase involved in cell wall biosynthesis